MKKTSNINKVTLLEYLRLRGIVKPADIESYDLEVFKTIARNGKGFSYEYSNEISTEYYAFFKEAKQAEHEYSRFK